jgi:hypothetical protein
MALTAGYGPARRGQPPTAGQFGGLVAAGEQIWRGGMMAWNAGGSLQRVQTTGSIVFAGLAERDYNNTASGVAAAVPPMVGLKGTFGLTVPGATLANLYQNVYATDDNTFTLSNAETGVFALGGSDTGTRVPASVTVAAGSKVGVYTGTVLSGAATFSFADPNGDALATGTIGTAYSAGGVGFTIPGSGGVAPIAGDTFTITVSESAGAMLVGTLAGIENGQTYVKLLGG